MKVVLVCLFVFVFMHGTAGYVSASPIVELGEQIKRNLGAKKGDGDTVRTQLLMYYGYLKDVLTSINDDISEGIETYRELRRLLGPPHVHERIYPLEFMRQYNCSLEEAKEVVKLIEDTKNLWLQIINTAANKKII